MKKKFQNSSKAFILLESILSLAILSTTVLLLQSTQLQMLRQTKKDEMNIQMLRVAFEEVRERRIHNLSEASYTVERDGHFTISYQKRPYAQIKIKNEQQDWGVYREK